MKLFSFNSCISSRVIDYYKRSSSNTSPGTLTPIHIMNMITIMSMKGYTYLVYKVTGR